MSLTIAKPEDTGGDFQILDEGTHAAICTWLVDLGPQELEFQGEVTEKPRIRLRFEVPAERAEWTDKEGVTHEGPMVIWKEYTASLHEKATLRAHLESWRGRAFTEDELRGFDLKAILGKPCMIAVTHRTGTNGKTYANITSISKLMKGLEVKAEGDLVHFDFDDHTDADFAQLPEWLQEKIKSGQQIQQRQRARVPAASAFPPADAYSDDIPF